MNEKEQLKEQIKKLQRKLAKMEKEPKVWKPIGGEKYYVIDNYGKTCDYEYSGDDFDNGHYIVGNCFKTEEEAERIIEKTKIYMRLKRYALEHNTEPIDWCNNRKYKYFIYLYHYNDKPDKEIAYTASTNRKEIGQIYFTSREIVEGAIKDIGEENIMKLFEED